jgi:hypothetical protein
MKYVACLGAAVAAVALCAPASATDLDISSGFAVFSGARSVVGTDYTDTFTFSTSNLMSISGIGSTHWLTDLQTGDVISDLDIVSIVLDGVAFTPQADNSDFSETYNLPSRLLGVGDHTLVVTFNVDTAIDTSAGYSGTLTLGAPGAVPEPATWAMFVGAFGAIGGVMRRRRTTRVSFA